MNDEGVGKTREKQGKKDLFSQRADDCVRPAEISLRLRLSERLRE